ncbi:MAG: hypothetical protein DLM55_12120 [Acidimicrobiales bacterium]|nr:MAG: hypothetical protein DLM55_12120 [Acidimicrobiales bacterium]
MGRIERAGSNGFTRYIWYPGNLEDWKRVGIALGTGVAAFVGLLILAHSMLWATLVSTTVTACMTGYALGNKDANSFDSISELRSFETGRALWRALAKGFGAAAAAVLVAHAAPPTSWSGWLLPILPAISGAVAHQCGIMQVRLSAVRQAQKSELRRAPVAAA